MTQTELGTVGEKAATEKAVLSLLEAHKLLCRCCVSWYSQRPFNSLWNDCVLDGLLFWDLTVSRICFS